MARPPKESGKPPRRPSHDELRIWDYVTQQDRRLPHARIDWQETRQQVKEAAKTPEPPAIPRADRDQIESLVRRASFTEAGEAHRAPPVSGGVDRNSARRLRQGKLPIEATLDLHGMTRDAARTALTGFLRHAFHNQKRCVLVITGKGKFHPELGQSEGVLRKHLPRWLALEPCTHWVLRHERAQPHHGGDGAFYILLRRQR